VDTYRSVPILKKKPKVTIYALDVFGQPFAYEVKLACHGRIEPKNLAGNHRQLGPAPFVAFTMPPGRRIQAMERTCYSSRYLLIIDGWVHPKPFAVRKAGETNAHRDPSMLQPWDDYLDEYIEAKDVEVLGDYRDLIEPDYLIRRDAATGLHRLERKPDLARMVIDEHEAQAKDQGCHDPKYWDGLRAQFGLLATA
jgi:hypothetical protein